MNQQKKNAEDAKSLSLQLNEITEIEQKIEYYKSIVKAFDDLSGYYNQKIEAMSLIENPTVDNLIELAKIKIEKLNLDSSVYEKKKFFEHWLKRKAEYDKKFELLTKECNENFEQVEYKAKKISETNVKFKSFIDKFAQEQNVTQKLKNEYYLMLKYEITRLEGKGVFLNS